MNFGSGFRNHNLRVCFSQRIILMRWSDMPFACKHYCKTLRHCAQKQKSPSKQSRYSPKNARAFVVRCAFYLQYFGSRINGNTYGNSKGCKTLCRSFYICASKHGIRYWFRNYALICPVCCFRLPPNLILFPLQITHLFPVGHFDHLELTQFFVMKRN